MNQKNTFNRRRMRARSLIGAGLLAIFALPIAVALQRTAPPPPEGAPEIIIPKRSDIRPPGPPGIKRPGEVNWAAVKAIVADTEQREAIFARQSGQFDTTRVLTPEERQQINEQRPKGIRAVSLTQIRTESMATGAAAQETARARIPVLVPFRQEMADGLEIYANENSYTANFDLPGGASVEVTGTRMRVTVRDGDMIKRRSSARKRASRALAGVNAQYVISRHDQGVDLSFSKFNIAYMITIYCPSPDDDDRCAEDGFVVSLAEDLALLNAAEGDAQ